MTLKQVLLTLLLCIFCGSQLQAAPNDCRKWLQPTNWYERLESKLLPNTFFKRALRREVYRETIENLSIELLGSVADLPNENLFREFVSNFSESVAKAIVSGVLRQSQIRDQIIKARSVVDGQYYYLVGPVPIIFSKDAGKARFARFDNLERAVLLDIGEPGFIRTSTSASGMALQYVETTVEVLTLEDISPVDLVYRLADPPGVMNSREDNADRIVAQIAAQKTGIVSATREAKNLRKAMLKGHISPREIRSLMENF